jgi:predicted kinase
MLYIFGGLPGTGKSTLSAALAQRCHAVYLRIDTIEQALRDCGFAVDGPAGYVVGYQFAKDNLRLGRSVVADSVNPLEITRKAWRDVAMQANAPFVEIEVLCSHREEHRARIESRKADIAGFPLPRWTDVLQRQYEPWSTERIVLDSAGESPDESMMRLFRAVDDWRRHEGVDTAEFSGCASAHKT